MNHKAEEPPNSPQGSSLGNERERRSKSRVKDDQSTGKGSEAALSRLRMLERRRSNIAPRDEPEF